MSFYLVNFATWLISLLPVRMLIWLSYPLGRLTWSASHTKRNSTIKNLEACYPDMSEEQRASLARESMRHYVLTILETGLVWHASAKRINRMFDDAIGWDALVEAQEQGRGVILLVPHWGNWELINQWVQHYFILESLYKPGSAGSIEAILVAKRKRLGGGMVPANQSGLKHIYKCLNEGRTVAVLPDQEPSTGQGRFVPFFGVPAFTGVLAHRLIQRTGCLALYALGQRYSNGRFVCHFVPATEAVYSSDPDEALAAINLGIEHGIEIDRAQYLWAYKRFKKRPEGYPRFYGG